MATNKKEHGDLVSDIPGSTSPERPPFTLNNRTLEGIWSFTVNGENYTTTDGKTIYAKNESAKEIKLDKEIKNTLEKEIQALNKEKKVLVSFLCKPDTFSKEIDKNLNEKGEITVTVTYEDTPYNLCISFDQRGHKPQAYLTEQYQYKIENNTICNNLLEGCPEHLKRQARWRALSLGYRILWAADIVFGLAIAIPLRLVVTPLLSILEEFKKVDLFNQRIWKTLLPSEKDASSSKKPWWKKSFLGGVAILAVTLNTFLLTPIRLLGRFVFGCLEGLVHGAKEGVKGHRHALAALFESINKKLYSSGDTKQPYTHYDKTTESFIPLYGYLSVIFSENKDSGNKLISIEDDPKALLEKKADQSAIYIDPTSTINFMLYVGFILAAVTFLMLLLSHGALSPLLIMATKLAGIPFLHAPMSSAALWLSSLSGFETILITTTALAFCVGAIKTFLLGVATAAIVGVTHVLSFFEGAVVNIFNGALIDLGLVDEDSSTEGEGNEFDGILLNSESSTISNEYSGSGSGSGCSSDYSSDSSN